MQVTWNRAHYAALAVILLLSVAHAWPARAHDSWISRSALRNGAGEWCCGEGDCALIEGSAVHVTAAGYVIRGYSTLQFSDPALAVREWITDTVPYSEVQPSPDGTYVRCQRLDKSRRRPGAKFAPQHGALFIFHVRITPVVRKYLVWRQYAGICGQKAKYSWRLAWRSRLCSRTRRRAPTCCANFWFTIRG